MSILKLLWILQLGFRNSPIAFHNNFLWNYSFPNLWTNLGNLWNNLAQLLQRGGSLPLILLNFHTLWMMLWGLGVQ